MPPNYTPWTWSPPHGRHYSYQITDDGAIINTFWSGPVAPAAPVAPSSIDATVTAPTSSTPRYSQQPSVVVPTNRSIPGGSYPSEIYTLNPKPTEVIRVEDDESNAEDGNKVEEDEKEEPRIDSPHEAPYKSSNTLVPRPASNTSHTQQYANTVVYGSTQCSPYRNTSYEPSLGYQLVNPYTLPVNAQTFRPTIASLPLDVQADIGYKDRRFIQTSTDQNDLEQLDTRYRRVARPHHPYFFIPGRVSPSDSFEIG
ncbi:uncharacterized protein K460DRAFT_80172 [Cucurbitaria berberidis CBS 394.84]|uniref:Uncharacterized protein n=1 Tax=Cucurbitaria berberidis CBS 394.84 TaxID=1168544 RepID=A0A9P4LB58_9PLEO|nr:uncharacterized protein K460DRAFT_80172 [Cucurbitaria berberidis CBS 394.84]KAF1848720.1 hypothetical protein K460DRAFT_80172 [Cucurbitaria berberidis CBS 394.84]